jgi:hypothetical protein
VVPRLPSAVLRALVEEEVVISLQAGTEQAQL